MHRDVVTHVAVSSADFFITGSDDGKILISLSLKIDDLEFLDACHSATPSCMFCVCCDYH